MRTGVSGIPISSSSASRDSEATSVALRPSTISISIEVAAWEIAHPRPEKLDLVDGVAVLAKATKMETSSPQSGFCPSACASASSINPWPRGFL